MKTIRDVMTSDVVWVSPSARVKTAIVLMKGHNIGALPIVVEADQSIVGIVTHYQLLGEREDAAVADVMNTDYTVCNPDYSVIEAAELMQDTGSKYLLVVEDERLVGIVSISDLLPEIGKTFDPLTSLPWSDTFREWALNALKHGLEISVIFFDLDKFGMFNKKYGHVVGDTVLKQIADVIIGAVDSNIDCACRYGGDEFAIVNIRNADDSLELAKSIQKSISRIKITDVPDSVSATFGISGGRRTRERDDIHYAATIDNLITRASKECMEKKQKSAQQQTVPAVENGAGRQHVPEPLEATPEVPVPKAAPVPVSPKPQLHDVSLSSSPLEYTANVTLTLQGELYTGSATKSTASPRPIMELVAEATAIAASHMLEPGYGLSIEDVIVSEVGRSEEVVTVLAVLATPTSSTRFPASTLAQRGDYLRPVALAVIEALNRYHDHIHNSQN